MKSGVYIIRMGKYYYFGSSVNLRERELAHIRELKKNAHRNRFMQRVYNASGLFDFSVLKFLEKTEMLKMEQDLIDEHKSFRECMNLATVATNSFSCPRARAATVKANKERVWTKEMREKSAAARRGKKMPWSASDERFTKWKGSGNPNARMNDEDRERLLLQRSSGESIKSLAKSFKVNRTTITRICSASGVYYKPTTWSPALRESQQKVRIDNPEKWARDNRGERNPRARLKRSDIPEISRRILEGESLAAIARSYGVTPETIGAIKSGKNWKTETSALIAQFARIKRL